MSCWNNSITKTPQYSVKDLAPLLGVSLPALSGRIFKAKEKPTVSCVTHKGDHRKTVNLYEKEPFLKWHQEHWGHLTNE